MDLTAMEGLFKLYATMISHQMDQGKVKHQKVFIQISLDIGR